jgi:hypothetical protein
MRKAGLRFKSKYSSFIFEKSFAHEEAPGSSCKGLSEKIPKSGLKKPLFSGVWPRKSHIWARVVTCLLKKFSRKFAGVLMNPRTLELLRYMDPAERLRTVEQSAGFGIS